MSEAMMARKKRKRYTPAQRSEVLQAAEKQGLTAAQVQKKFGVTPVTYYSWRKKSGAAGRRGRRGPGRPPGTAVAGQVRTEVQARVRAMLPGIVRQEVNSYLDSLFGTGRRGVRRA
jgi:transposase-like protein